MDQNVLLVETVENKTHRRNADIRRLFWLILVVLASLALFGFLLSVWWTRGERGFSGIPVFVVGGCLCLIGINEISDAIYELCQPDDQDDQEYNIPCTNDCSMGTPWFIKWLIRKSKAMIKRYRATSKPVHSSHSIV